MNSIANTGQLALLRYELNGILLNGKPQAIASRDGHCPLPTISAKHLRQQAAEEMALASKCHEN